MKKQSAIVILLLTVCLNPVKAQSPAFKSFTIQDGLSGNRVRKIFQDSKGFIWICTWDGVSKYDGHRFTNFSRNNGLTHDIVNDICELNGKLFVALNNGMTYAIVNDRVVPKAVIENNTIERFVKARNGKIRAITSQHGIMDFSGEKLLPLSPSIKLSDGSMLTVEDSSFLVGSPDLETLHLLNSKFEIASKSSGPITVYALFEDSRKRIWAGCGDGLKQVLMNPKNRTLSLVAPSYPFRDSFVLDAMVQCIWEDHHKDLWIGTRYGLVLIKEGGSIQRFTKTDGLPDEHIYSVFEDSEKNIWIGTAQGIARFSNQGRNTYWNTQKGLLDDAILDIVKGESGYFITNFRGIQKIVPENIQIKTLKAPFDLLWILRNSQSSSFTYIHTSNPTGKGYIGRIDLKNQVIKDIVTYILPDRRNFFTMTVSNKGTYVIGTHGLATISNGQVRFDSTIKDLVTCLFIDDSILWVGTHSNGLYRVRFEEDEDIILSNYTRVLSLPDSMIRSIYKDIKDVLWIGTRFNGVYRIVEEKNQTYRAEQIDKSRGLISNWVRFITEDKYYNIWIGSNSGVDKLLKSENGWRVFNFSKLNNLFGVVNTILPDSDGSIWVGMNNGLAHIYEAGFDTLPPRPVYITSIETHLKEDSSITPNDYGSLSLPYSNNAISFNFTSPSFINEKEMKYSFRLVSHRDTAWSNPSNQNSVSYASLEPGSYRFEVKNLGWNGEWGDTTSYSFIVRPPFWKTWWFILVLVFGVLLILYLFYRYRINQLRRIQLVRNRIATDLHDDIGSALTNISILTELSKRNRHEPEKAESYIDRIREEIDSSGQALDDIIWSVNTKNDTLHETAARMRRYASELFDTQNIRYDLTMDPHIADKKIRMEQRRDLFLIFKEGVNNIHKHAGATSVSISLFVEKEMLNLVISDDGKGFDTSQPTHRNGISNIKNRVGRWKGQIDVQSGNGNGTIIKIALPLSIITQKGE